MGDIDFKTFGAVTQERPTIDKGGDHQDLQVNGVTMPRYVQSLSVTVLMDVSVKF